MARLGFPRYAERIARPDGVTGPAWYRWLRDLWAEVMSLRSDVTALETQDNTTEDAEPATYDEILVLLAWALRRIDFLEKCHNIDHGCKDPGAEPDEAELLDGLDIYVRSDR